MKHKQRSGFTLVEINLAIVFVAILLLGIAALTLHIGGLYQRGITIKNVNQIGREVTGQMQKDVAAANSSAVASETAAETGRICLGNVSYLYNTARGLSDGVGGLLVREGFGVSARPIALVRIVDPEAIWCDREPSGGFVVGPGINEQYFTDGEASELMQLDEYAALAAHSVELTQLGLVDQNTTQALYSLSIRIGTADVSKYDEGVCRPPTDTASDFRGCFVADFTTIIRAGEVR